MGNLVSVRWISESPLLKTGFRRYSKHIWQCERQQIDLLYKQTWCQCKKHDFNFSWPPLTQLISVSTTLSGISIPFDLSANWFDVLVAHSTPNSSSNDNDHFWMFKVFLFTCEKLPQDTKQYRQFWYYSTESPKLEIFQYC